MGIERILVVNSDAEDILAMQKRIPETVEVLGASHWQADEGIKQSPSLVVLDNDANDLKEARGVKTLEMIREQDSEVPVVYTSFQPGWVAGEVYQTKGVTVVKTDEALDFIAKEYGLELLSLEPSVKIDPELSMIVTYNKVDGYEPGLYGDGKLLIHSFDKYAGELAKSVLKEEIQEIYKDFEWKADRDLIKKMFVYDGINGGEWPGRIASALGHDVRMPIELMACHCDWDRKRRLESMREITLYQVECGGSKTLGAIADVILGIKRPGVDYDSLPISVDKIMSSSAKSVI